MSMTIPADTAQTPDYTNLVNYPYETASGSIGDDTESGAQSGEFAGLLAKALEELKTSTITNNLSGGLGTGISPDFGMTDPMFALGMPGLSAMQPAMTDSLEQAILNASSTGKSEDAMIALLMLMMMMQSGSEGGDSAMMMQMMAAMIGQMQDKEKIRSDFLYSSGGEPYTLDTIDANVFGYNPGEFDFGRADLPLQWWRPTTVMITSNESNRDPALYRAVVDQFDVENAERYRPGREGHTYCNIYAWDVTRAMGAEIPYYSDPKTGEPVQYPDTKGASTNSARAMDRWLKTYGGTYGWRQVTAQEAQFHANQGKPAVASGGEAGHISVIVPAKEGDYDPSRGVMVAQAGAKVTNYSRITNVFGSEALSKHVTYWIHG